MTKKMAVEAATLMVACYGVGGHTGALLEKVGVPHAGWVIFALGVAGLVAHIIVRNHMPEDEP